MSELDDVLPADEPNPTPEAPHEPAAPVEVLPVESAAPALPETHVEVELLHDVAVCVHSTWHTFVAGANVIRKDILELIKQTHQKSALRE